MKNQKNTHEENILIDKDYEMSKQSNAKIKRSAKAEEIFSQITSKTLLGDLRKIAKEIKRDHELAMELWATEEVSPRLLAILIMDKNLLTEEDIDELVSSLQAHDYKKRNNLMDWLMANQLMKDKKKIALIESWEKSPLVLQRRTYWYYQGRLRWTGKTPPDNTEALLSAMEARIMEEEPEVQWAMNFTAGWIGVYEDEYRTRCIELGEGTGLYKGDHVSKGCTPNYLPEFIEIEYGKRNK